MAAAGWFWLRLRSALCALVLAVCLSACSLRSEPPRALVIEALSAQIIATQDSIADSLGLERAVVVPSVSRVRISHQETLQLEGERFIHLEGSFDWQLPNDSVRVDSAFELFLQRGERDQGWTLARPVHGEGDQVQRWLLYPLGLPQA